MNKNNTYEIIVISIFTPLVILVISVSEITFVSKVTISLIIGLFTLIIFLYSRLEEKSKHFDEYLNKFDEYLRKLPDILKNSEQADKYLISEQSNKSQITSIHLELNISKDSKKRNV